MKGHITKKSNIMLICLITILLSLLASATATEESLAFGKYSTIFYVGGTGDGNYTSIQTAIDNASEGDTIYVYGGTYFEHIIINKSINLIGEDKSITVVDGGKTGDVINITASRVNISGFTIMNSALNTSYSILVSSGLRIESHFNNISHCDIMNCDIAIALENSLYNSIKNCKIFNNTNGVYFYNSSHNQVANCTIFFNNRSHGISLQKSSYNNVSHCNISLNNACGIAASESSNNTITSNIFWNNIRYGIRFFYTKTKVSINNVIFANNFIGNGINAQDDCDNLWNGEIIGNFWDDYTGIDHNGDGIGETPYYVPYKLNEINQDIYPMMEPLKLEIATPMSILVNIVHPQDDSIVNGIVLINGTCEGADIQIVKVRIDEEEWQTANGTTNWQLKWNTSKYKQGLHVIYVYGLYEGGYSKIKHITVIVKNQINEEDNISGFEILLILGAFLLVMFARKIKIGN